METLKMINRMLFFLSALLLGYILFALFFSKTRTPPSLPLSAETALSEDFSDEKSLTKLNPFSFYQEKMKGSSIFDDPWLQRSSPPPVKTEPVKESQIIADKSLEISKQLKLVGIILDSNPKAIIEDLKSKETRFISPGESIQEAVLEKIEKGKIILRYNNKIIELGL